MKAFKVLVVDDEKVARKCRAKMLDKLKISYDLAENGQQAIDKISAGDYALVLLDKDMPIMDGVEVLQTLCAPRASGRPATDLPAFIMVSSNEDAGALVSRYKPHVKGWVDKKHSEFNTQLLAAITAVRAIYVATDEEMPPRRRAWTTPGAGAGAGSGTGAGLQSLRRTRIWGQKHLVLHCLQPCCALGRQACRVVHTLILAHSACKR